METTAARDSTLFPPGYGEVTLQSNDGLLCHFSRHSLAYMSNFFRGMFELPVVERQAGHQVEGLVPLQMTESGQILELFLVHIDPKHPTPSIDPSTIEALLEMAQKYEAPTITEWFMKNALLEERSKVSTSSVLSEAFISTHPVLALHCAVRFNLPSTGQFALREFAGCNVSRIIGPVPSISLHAYLTGIRLREERINAYENMIEEMTTKHISTACGSCLVLFARWLFRVQSTVRKEPRWEVFERVNNSCPPDCTHARHSVSLGLDSHNMDRWGIQHAESILPVWTDLVNIVP